MKKKIKFPKADKKLYHVNVNAIEYDELYSNGSPAFREVSQRKEAVIASTADEAMSRVKLVKNKHYEEYYSGVALVSEIDYL